MFYEIGSLLLKPPFQGCFALDPSQRLTCQQLLDHSHFDKRLTDLLEQKVDESRRREKKPPKERDQKSRNMVSKIIHVVPSKV